MAIVRQPRKTKQKEAIREAFLESDRPLSPEEIKELAQRKVQHLNVATIYRNVKALIEEKWLIPVEMPGATTRYELAGKEHHHHFLCNNCGKLYDLQGCNTKFKLKLPRGFHATGHELFLYGTCVSCKRLS